MSIKPGWVAVVAIVLLSTAAQPQTSIDRRAAERAKAVFGASESVSEVDLNVQFGYGDANQSALKTLQEYVLALNDSSLQGKTRKAQKECVTKACKGDLSPLRNLVKEWDHFRKNLGTEEENYAMMGEAAGGIRFYYRNAPQLDDTLRKPLQSLSLKQAKLAAEACGRSQRCPASIKTAFEELAEKLQQQTGTREQAESSLRSIREQI